MFQYKKMFKPYTKDGATLDNSIAWLKKTTGADDDIIDLAIADTLSQIAMGEKFALPCPCGCEMTNVHTPINHYMLSVTLDLKNQTDKPRIDIIRKKQMDILELNLKVHSQFDKDYNKLLNGTRVDRFLKFLHLPYNTWENEK